MKITIKLTIVILLFSIGLNDIQAQMATDEYAEKETYSIKTYNGFQDSKLKSTQDSSGSSVIQGGIGFGYLMNGGFLSIKCKFVSSVGWGTSLDFMFGAPKTKNLPSDYAPLFYPRDNRTVVSLNIVKVLTGHGQNPRFSAEVGPSLVRIDNAKITPNPNYDPNSIWHLSKYFKSREVENALGLSMSVETEILLTSFMIMDISVFANLNKAKSFLGIGLYIDFGNVKD
jgi:hypothetical protein